MPHCQTVMEEKPGWGGDLRTPQLPADDQPPALKATRVGWERPKCAHIEESLPSPSDRHLILVFLGCLTVCGSEPFVRAFPELIVGRLRRRRS
jgi:hypothetical protein